MSESTPRGGRSHRHQGSRFHDQEARLGRTAPRSMQPNVIKFMLSRCPCSPLPCEHAFLEGKISRFDCSASSRRETRFTCSAATLCTPASRHDIAVVGAANFQPEASSAIWALAGLGFKDTPLPSATFTRCFWQLAVFLKVEATTLLAVLASSLPMHSAWPGELHPYGLLNRGQLAERPASSDNPSRLS